MVRWVIGVRSAVLKTPVRWFSKANATAAAASSRWIWLIQRPSGVNRRLGSHVDARLTEQESPEQDRARRTVKPRESQDATVRLDHSLLGRAQDLACFPKRLRGGLFAHPGTIGLGVNARAARENEPPSRLRSNQVPHAVEIDTPVGVNPAAAPRGGAMDGSVHRFERPDKILRC